MARNLCRHGMNGTPAGVSLALQAPTPRPPSQLERACRCVRKYYRKRCILSLCWSLVRSLLAASLGSVQAVLALQQEAALRQQRVWLLALLG
jgi:hypothetical protein